MKTALTIGSAMLALTAIASTADARMGGMNMPSSSMSRIDTHTTMPTSLGSPRGFSPDGHTFSPDGHTFTANGRTFSPDGLQGHAKGWKKPIDSDGGGPSDPPKKTPKVPTQTTDNGNGGGYPNRPWGSSWYWHHHHPYGGGYNNATGGDVPQRDCRGC